MGCYKAHYQEFVGNHLELGEHVRRPNNSKIVNRETSIKKFTLLKSGCLDFKNKF
jgi:hypothetical protein